MTFGTIASPDEVAVMARVLDAYCMQAGIVERENIATQIVALSRVAFARKTSF